MGSDQVLTVCLNDEDRVIDTVPSTDMREAQGTGRQTGIDQRVAFAQNVVFAIAGRRANGPDVRARIVSGAN